MPKRAPDRAATVAINIDDDLKTPKKSRTEDSIKRRSPRSRQQLEESRDRRNGGRRMMYKMRHLLDARQPYNGGGGGNYSSLKDGRGPAYRSRKTHFSTGRRQEDSLADRLAMPNGEKPSHPQFSSRGHYRLRSHSLTHHHRNPSSQPHPRNTTRHYGNGQRPNGGGQRFNQGPKRRRGRIPKKPLPAPLNTTQFLMADQNCKSPNYELIMEQIQKNHSRNNNVDGNEPPSDQDHDDGEEYFSSAEDEEAFILNQFSETYDNLQTEKLNAMSKPDLVRAYMVLEGHVDDLTKQLRATEQPPPSAANGSAGQRPAADMVMPDSSAPQEGDDDEESVEEEPQLSREDIKRLLEDNRRLRSENNRLRQK